jgi:hypothetical protein
MQFSCPASWVLDLAMSVDYPHRVGWRVTNGEADHFHSQRPTMQSDQPIDCREMSLLHYLTCSKDFTLFWQRRSAPTQVEKHFDDLDRQYGSERKRAGRFESLNGLLPLIPARSEATSPLTRDTLISRGIPQVSIADEPLKGRACVCRCYKDRYLSGTFRADGKAINLPIESSVQWRCAVWGKQGEYLVETADLIEQLWRIIFPSPRAAHNRQRPCGLIVFSGATNSAKSNLAQAFALRAIQQTIHECKEDNWKNLRMPHLVTFEDPIEPWTITTRRSRPKETRYDPKNDPKHSELNSDPSSAARLGFVFTPREKGFDVFSLTDALLDAKRQTPACFYISEIRSQRDWQPVVDFAGTGHLVVTTSHASSLSESAARIMQCRSPETAAERRWVGSNLAACVHIERSPLSDITSVVLPTVWSRRGAALNSLVGDGLSSITPNNDYVLSRSQFLAKLILSKSVGTANKVVIDKAKAKAIEADIRELQKR